MEYQPHKRKPIRLNDLDIKVIETLMVQPWGNVSLQFLAENGVEYESVSQMVSTGLIHLDDETSTCVLDPRVYVAALRDIAKFPHPEAIRSLFVEGIGTDMNRIKEAQRVFYEFGMNVGQGKPIQEMEGYYLEVLKDMKEKIGNDKGKFVE
ncbi:MAG: hypothetical protein UT34_C0001G0280 [candidate division WS6 bacterium GW2011_GWF2_39_15]|uniref:Uncharacterized protein n=1 Tax=candidate division WS6 bacterium GW2011_GWF2_39_15 TaxID=1619100 RepID=A0A0G0Q741_9BACT|nr:MAG: hypothetical protein UT34_C0001G0280 [candidate division WS6 bacterium GW2011_GWF2_39_15]